MANQVPFQFVTAQPNSQSLATSVAKLVPLASGE
jgi:hypothetical protein